MCKLPECHGEGAERLCKLPACHGECAECLCKLPECQCKGIERLYKDVEMIHNYTENIIDTTVLQSIS